MRKGFFVFSLALVLAIGAMTVFSPGPAQAADKLLVCAVCDKSFYETAVKVVTEMNLADKVTVKVTYFDKVEKLAVPVDLRVGLGVGTKAAAAPPAGGATTPPRGAAAPARAEP